MATSAKPEGGLVASGLSYVADAARDAVSTIDGAMQTKVPLAGTVGDVVQGIASRVPIAGGVIELAREAAAAVETATQPGLTRTQKATTLSKCIFWIALRRHPLYGLMRIALFCVASFAALFAVLVLWWLL